MSPLPLWSACMFLFIGLFKVDDVKIIINIIYYFERPSLKGGMRKFFCRIAGNLYLLY